MSLSIRLQSCTNCENGYKATKFTETLIVMSVYFCISHSYTQYIIIVTSCNSIFTHKALLQQLQKVYKLERFH